MGLMGKHTAKCPCHDTSSVCSMSMQLCSKEDIFLLAYSLQILIKCRIAICIIQGYRICGQRICAASSICRKNVL